MKCKECNYEYEGNPKFCPECGKPTINNNNREKDEDDDDEGGILNTIGNIVGKTIGG